MGIILYTTANNKHQTPRDEIFCSSCDPRSLLVVLDRGRLSWCRLVVEQRREPSRALRAPEFLSLCDTVETRKKCKKQASDVPCTKCKWDKDTNTCTLGPVKKKKCKKDKRCAWTGNKGDKTCTEKPPKPPKLCDSYNKRKKCIKKTVDGIPCEWVDNGCYLDVS